MMGPPLHLPSLPPMFLRAAACLIPSHLGSLGLSVILRRLEIGLLRFQRGNLRGLGLVPTCGMTWGDHNSCVNDKTYGYSISPRLYPPLVRVAKTLHGA